ncbi:MAG: HAMP domain-containing protein [Inquilinus sp.]|nr:HAMP domain-containing protein [Inquilinus sp.]
MTIDERATGGLFDAAPSSRDRAARWSASDPWIKRFLPRTLFGRTLLIIITPFLLMQVIATYYFYDQHWKKVTRRLANGVAGEIALVIEELERRENESQVIFAQAARTMGLVMTFHESATLEAQPGIAGSPILASQLREALSQRLDLPFIFDPDVTREYALIQVQLETGVLHTRVPSRRLFSSTSQVFVLWMMGSGLILFALSLLFMRKQIGPILRLAIAADRFGKGRDVPNFRPEGALEVRQAAAAFLVMRERIQRQITQRTDMLAGVSHDLRTPLTRMKLQLAMLGDGPEIEDLKADVAEMETMIDGYLAFARGEGGEQPEQTDLGAVLAGVIAGARREGATIDADIEAGLSLMLRPKAMKRCLANLLSNAVRHADRIWISARRSGNRFFEVTVDDDGPGIADQLLADAFKPFFRIDASRNQQTGGAGLGLTIARDIVRGHGGELRLGRAPQGGLRCQLRLPV